MVFTFLNLKRQFLNEIFCRSCADLKHNVKDKKVETTQRIYLEESFFCDSRRTAQRNDCFSSKIKFEDTNFTKNVLFFNKLRVKQH